jgi:hypothetical protein
VRHTRKVVADRKPIESTIGITPRTSGVQSVIALTAVKRTRVPAPSVTSRNHCER